jgi:pimeloyl-ACP methyl ester carboxylesterase
VSLQQTWDEANVRRDQKPVLIVPGYGMNSFIFGYHPRGRSFEAALVRGGLEVWRVDLRGQGPSKNVSGSEVYGLEDLAGPDLGAAISGALDRTRTSASSAVVIGASLGGTIMFAHAALTRDHHIAAMVAIGAPVRWVRVHPLMRIAFASPRLIGLVPVRGSRVIARNLLPALLRRTPWLLSMYINAEHVDLDFVDELVKTVEDPNRHVNREIAEWIRRRDLVFSGINLSAALPSIRVPLLSVVSSGDGIVPRATAEYPHLNVGSWDRTLLEVGSTDMRLGQADVFISDAADEIVYGPIREWILARGA